MIMAASHAVTQDFSEPEVPGEAVKQGRKRQRNPENWKVKHIKKKGLPRKDLLSLEACCKKEFFSLSS